MKLIIDKSKCRITESLNGRAIEIETEDEIYINDRLEDCLLFPADGGYNVDLFNKAYGMRKPKGFDSFTPVITPVPKGYTL